MVSVAGPKVTAGLEVEVHRFRLSQVSSGSFGERSVMSPLLTLHPTCLPTGKAFWIPACAEEKTQHFRGSGFFLEVGVLLNQSDMPTGLLKQLVGQCPCGDRWNWKP